MTVAGRGYFAVDRQRFRQIVDHLGGPDAHLLLHLALEADPDTRTVRGNLKELGELCGVSPKRMRVALPRLEAAGLVVFHRGVNGEERGAGRVEIVAGIDARPRHTAPETAGVMSTTAPTPRPHRAHTAPETAGVTRGNAHKTEDRRQKTETPLASLAPQAVEKQFAATEETPDMNTPLPLDNLEHDLAPVIAIDATFEQFWQRYPRRVGKKKARELFTRFARQYGADVILDGLEAQLDAGTLTARGDRYCPHPSTWLNRGSWDDDPRHGANAGALDTGVARALADGRAAIARIDARNRIDARTAIAAAFGPKELDA